MKKLEEHCSERGDETSEMATKVYFCLMKVNHFCKLHDEQIALAKKRLPVTQKIWGRGSEEVFFGLCNPAVAWLHF